MSALREIIARFAFDFDDAGVKKADSAIFGLLGSVKEFAGALGAGLGVGFMFHFVAGLAEEADALQKQSDALGLSMKEMQEWQYAAMMQNVSAEALTKTLGRLSGGKYDAKALAELGVKAEESGGKLKSGTDLLEDVAEGLSKIEDPSKRNAIAMKVLGKSYLQLMPLLQGGAKGIQELRDEFDQLGGGFTEDFAKQADAFGDNIDRLKTVWKNFTIVVVGRVLPALLTLSTRAFQLAPRIIDLVKHSKALETAAIMLGTKGLVFLSGKIGPLGAALKTLSRQFFTVILPLLILEDFLVFLAGGDSLFGRIVDKIFGEDTSEKIRGWVSNVKGEFLGFIADLKSRPGKLADDWQVFTNALSADINALFGETFGGVLNTAGGMFVTFLDLLTGGWDNFKTKSGAVWDEIALMWKIVWSELDLAFLQVAAKIGDNFVNLWNFIVTGVQSSMRLVGKLLEMMGAAGLADKLTGGVVRELEAVKGGSLNDMVVKARDLDRTRFASDYDAIQARLSGAKPPEISARTQVNVTVPPGTPEETAQRVGKAAADGAERGINTAALRAQTVPGG